jgi:adenine deaminase
MVLEWMMVPHRPVRENGRVGGVVASELRAAKIVIFCHILSMPSLTANLVDLHQRRIYPAKIAFADNRITAIQPVVRAEAFILPGFIDAHVHIESSMMVPSEFARMAVRHGTVGTVSDPHEIANVLGISGVRFMVEQGRRTNFHFHWGVPSCVPATMFETAGAAITPSAVRELFEKDGLGYLSEMMNYPGVLHADPIVMEKIRIAQELGRPIDGHAPGLFGDEARRYAAAGMSTDHECFSLSEALDKIAVGMKILIREGSAAKNFAALEPLLKSHPDWCMFCTDDTHPDTLSTGHINRLVQRGLASGADLFDVLRIACLHPIDHYGLNIGQLRMGDSADFIIVDDLTSLAVRQTWIRGECVFRDGQTCLPKSDCATPNHFLAQLVRTEQFRLAASSPQVRVIGVRGGQLMTDELVFPANIQNGYIEADRQLDVLKITVVNRYQPVAPVVALIHGFGLQRGALAASVAHDSHNIVAVGASDEELCRAINALIDLGGGLAVVDGHSLESLHLPVAGLMGTDGDTITSDYLKLDAAARQLGSKLAAPFMTLSFMALLVIPKLKLSDLGLFDGEAFRFVDIGLTN